MTTATPDLVDAATVRQWLERHGDPGQDTVIDLRDPTPAHTGQPRRPRRGQHPLVLDVRSPAEFEAARVPGSFNVPLDLLDRHAGQLADRLDREVVLVCQSGARARQAQQRLAGAGAQHLHVLDGGIQAFRAAGGDVVAGRARWSLERQVRLVAGSLVLGSLTASLRLPKARLLAAGVGAGLTISALSDTCTMGRLLSVLPYNRGPRQVSAQEVLDRLPSPQQP